MRWVIVACVSLVACRGEQVGEAITDASALDDSAAGDDAISESGADSGDVDPASDAGCPTGSTNLLMNGDFESWVAGTPDYWQINPAHTAAAEGTDETSGKFARVTVKATGNGPQQMITLPVPLPKGCKLYYSARARYVSGPNTPTPDLFMYMYDDMEMSAPGRGTSFGTYGSNWSSQTAIFTADRTVVKVQAFVLGNAVGVEQVFDFDDAVVSYSPP